MNRWQKVKLGKLLNIKYGKDHKKVTDGDYPIYGSGGIMRYGNECLYSGESILIPRKGTLNNIFYINEPFWTVDTMFWTVPNRDIVYPKFLYYQLRLIDFAGLNVGSAVPSLTVKVLNDIEVSLPSLEEQRRIAGILGALDDKIELNNRINRNLEQQAKALFKRWFVDFEFTPLSFIVDVRDGTHDSPKKTENGYCLITSKHLLANGTIDYTSAYKISEFDYEQINKRSKVEDKDILFSMIGTIGNTLIVEDAIINFAIKNVALIRTSQCKDYSYLLYLYLQCAHCNEYILSRLSGSTQQYITLKSLREMPVPKLNKEKLANFNRLLTPLFTTINSNRVQNQTLRELRDALLPKLMNNEI